MDAPYPVRMRQKTFQVLSIALFVTLLLWGGYTLLYYLGVPIHAPALLPTEANEMLSRVHGNEAFITRGIAALFPVLRYTIARVMFATERGAEGMVNLLWGGPLFWYVILSLCLYGLFVLWKWLSIGSPRINMRLKFVHLLGLFIASLWLVFFSLSHSFHEGMPVRHIVEPVREIYTNIDDTALRELQLNFAFLKARGCLNTLQESSPTTIGIFEIREFCLQRSFFERVVTLALVVIVLLFEFLVLGSALLWVLRLRPQRLGVDILFSLGAGVAGWIVLLWLLALMALFTANAGWVLVIAVPLLLYRFSWYWIRRLATESWHIDVAPYDLTVLLAWLLLSYIALNFLSVVRPFPIGWDDLGSYLNRPRLLVSYGHNIFSMGTFQWEYLTALGFLLFGAGTNFGASSAMMINWTAGLLAVLMLWVFGATYLGRGRGILTALLYYSLPLVGHFSYADMKIDNALFFMGGLAVFGAFLGLLPPSSGEKAASSPSGGSASVTTEEGNGQRTFPGESGWWKWLVLSGAFCGFAFSAKSTAVMVFMALLSVLLGVLLHWSGFIVVALLAFVVFSMKGILSVQEIWQRMWGEGVQLPAGMFVFSAVLVAAVLLGYFTFRRRHSLRQTGVGIGVFLAAFIASITPWLMYNNIQAGNIIPRLELSPPNIHSPNITLFGTSPEEQRRQVVRSLPPELAVSRDHPACAASGTAEELDRYWGFDHGWKHYITLPWRTVMNLDSVGYYVTTMPALLLFPLLLLLPFFWSRSGRWLRWMFVLTIFIIFEWMFLANGIPWYGLGMFLGLSIGLEALLVFSPHWTHRILVGILLACSLFITFDMRFWQLEQQRNIFEYPIGKISAGALEARTIPWYDDIQKIVVDLHETTPDRPYLYRVGTFIPYFIPKNLEIIGVTDHQLDFFNCLHQERNPELTLKRLKALGFNSIIFDTNTSTIERDEKGSLHQKVQAFIDFVNMPNLGLKILVSDLKAGVAFVVIP